MNVLHDLEHTLRSVGSLTREAFVTYIPRIRDVIWRYFCRSGQPRKASAGRPRWDKDLSLQVCEFGGKELHAAAVSQQRVAFG
jgi:hypothetical protein